MEVGLSRRDTGLRARALFGPRLSRAAAAVGTRLDADPAEAEPGVLSRALVSTACRIPVVDGDVPGRNTEIDFLPGARPLLLHRLAARQRDERAARNASRAVRTAQHHLIRAALTRNRVDSDLRALQHGEILDVHKNVQGF